MTSTNIPGHLGQLLAVTADEIADVDWQTLADGVRYKVLWQQDPVVLGLMQLDAGKVNAEHTHHAAQHHIFLLSGTCRIAGRDLGPESYVYVPPGTPHAVENVGPEGCTFFYTYRPVAGGDEFPTGAGHPV